MKPEIPISDYLKTLEEKLLNPDVRNSSSELAELLSDDFMEIGSSGKVYYKEEVINTLQKKIACTIIMENYNSIQLTTGIVLITYKAVKINEPGSLRIISSRSFIWQLSGNKWQIVFHQGTPVSCI
jgi:hypothetical protein